MRNMPGVVGVCALVVVLLLAGGAVEAADQNAGTPEIDVDENAAVKAAAIDRFMPVDAFGVQVLFDPETMKLKAPTPEQASELSAALRIRFGNIEARTKAGGQQVLQKSGMTSMQLDGSHLNFSVVRIQPDGTLRYDCAEDHDHAVHLRGTPITGQETE